MNGKLAKAESAAAAPESSRAPASEAVRLALRAPITAMAATAFLWLAAGAALEFLALLVLQAPGLSESAPWLLFGRLRAAAEQALLYGFGVTAGLAAAATLLWRLAPMRRPDGGMMLLGIILWNVGALAGATAILAGAGSGVPWLESPPGLLLGMGGAYALVAGPLLAACRRSAGAGLYPSAWWAAAALLALPWSAVFAAAGCVAAPLRGVMQGAIQGWFAGNLLLGWFGALAAAAVFYLLPRFTSGETPTGRLLRIAFGAQFALAGFVGFGRLWGGPYPAWVSSLGAAAQWLWLPTALWLGASWRRAAHGSGRAARAGAALQCALAAATAFLFHAALLGAAGLAWVRRLIRFTWAEPGMDSLMILGAFGSAALGLCLFALPRLWERDWPSLGRLRRIAQAFLAGAALTAAGQIGAGFVQGAAWADPRLDSIAAAGRAAPLLAAAALGWLLLGGAAAGTTAAVLALVRRGRSAPAADAPELIWEETLP